MTRRTMVMLALIVLMLQACEFGALHVHSTAVLNSTVTETTGFIHPPAIPLPQKPSNSADKGAITSQSTSPIPTYDEQIGESFAQNFPSLAYNVTATAQSGAYGYGPTYLLNGVSNKGYWYQVGIGCGADFNTVWSSGFSFVYEVWNSSWVSVYGSNPAFNGTVNAGDEVLLNLYFLNGNVVMYVYDWNTDASASASYSAEGATYFVGNSNGVGFIGPFSGPMTELWLANPYNGTEQPVTYTIVASTALTSSEMFADEYDPSNGSGVFSIEKFFTYSNPGQLQYLTDFGTVEASNAYTFITGSDPLTVQAPTPISQTVMQGKTANITSGQIINGTAPYSYQWFVQTPGVSSYTPISGATSSSYAFSTSTSTNIGTYSFVLQVADSPSPVQNAGVQSSPPATVTVMSLGHAVAVTNVTLSKTLFDQGYPGSVIVAVQNQGSFTETFNVTIHVDTTPAASQNVTLSRGDSTNIILTWNTTGFAYGNYTISAYATLVQGETNTGDDNFTMSGVVTVTIPGDLNGDYQVNLKDLVLLAQAYGSTPGSPNWNPNADITGSGTVGLQDLVILAQHYGQHYP